MKIKMIQYLTGSNPDYNKLANEVEFLNKTYCKFYGYDYEFLRFKEQELEWADAVEYKIKYISETLNKQEYDYVVFVDADAGVANPTIKIEDLIDNEHHLFLSKCNERYAFLRDVTFALKNLSELWQNHNDFFYIKFLDEFIDDYPGLYGVFESFTIGCISFNEGFIVVKNSPEMREFFNTCTMFSKYFKNNVHKGLAADGAVIRFFLQQKQWNHLYTMMPVHAQGSVYSSFEYKFNPNKTFILHNYCDVPYSKRYEFMSQLKNNTNWQKIFQQLQ